MSLPSSNCNLKRLRQSGVLDPFLQGWEEIPLLVFLHAGLDLPLDRPSYEGHDEDEEDADG